MIDATHPVWIAVRDLCREGANNARNSLEQPGLDPVITEFQRGQVYAFRSVLALAEPETPTPTFETGTDI
jgi:hypothetical protein